ncbi:hypothetical protein SO802_011021 [Lithocarpus litseifolius]|uniref:Uncharacterized protein n=1 Tax=Lithocarpus litseifolius TaxID=425828 RepID=A0AAW2DIY2_9ROSI
MSRIIQRETAYIKYGLGGFEYSIWVMREYGVVESQNNFSVVPFPGHCIAFTEYGSLLSRCIRDQAKIQEYKF